MKDNFSFKEMTYFRVARSLSELSDHPQHKVGAIVVDKHQIISSGYNSATKHHRLQAELNKERFTDERDLGAVHAEVSALLPIYKHKDLRFATMFIYREHADGTYAMARPCQSCMKLIKQCGIKKIYYTTEDGLAVEILKGV